MTTKVTPELCGSEAAHTLSCHARAMDKLDMFLDHDKMSSSYSPPLLWRVIRRSSPHFYSENPEFVLGLAAFENDTEFWIRNEQLLVKHQPANLDGAVVTEARLPRSHSLQVEDVTRLYRCIRWCFGPLDDIIQTLRRSPHALKLYEIIVESLKGPTRSCKRRRPFGWRKYRGAYMTNDTNLVEFGMVAGDLCLAPCRPVQR
ncbi:Hypothetical protein PHPALM_19657 [Phytophthora palmivora]|uniref:Uncharacterized protein n=1 Tax=Phytophthora palmivora TaxID=4796 RepID=A0A2P4XGV5_9STRA|nr:Hypothetical protein PHPALM_19657 [Phytophthora palmivora]